MPEKTVAVLGAGGTMGLGISRNLLRAGFADNSDADMAATYLTSAVPSRQAAE